MIGVLWVTVILGAAGIFFCLALGGYELIKKHKGKKNESMDL